MNELNIREQLDMVKDIMWVVEECRTRATPDAESMQLILEYGLSRTHVPVDEQAESSVFHFFFGAKEMRKRGEREQENESGGGSCSSREKQFSPPIFFFILIEVYFPLSPKKKVLLAYRLAFLQYLDRLHTYKRINVVSVSGGTTAVPETRTSPRKYEQRNEDDKHEDEDGDDEDEDSDDDDDASDDSDDKAQAEEEESDEKASAINYNSRDYLRFRMCDLMEEVALHAHHEQFDKVAILLQCHPDEISPVDRFFLPSPLALFLFIPSLLPTKAKLLPNALSLSTPHVSPLSCAKYT